MLLRGPEKEAKLIEERTGVVTTAGVDGMQISFGKAIGVGFHNKRKKHGLDMFL